MRNRPYLAPEHHRASPPHCVLVAEDDAEFREVLSLTLRAAGLEVVEARDGSALLDCLADAIQDDGSVHKYDLIVSDIRMPGYSGLDVLAGAKRILSHTPVVLLTGFGDARTHELARHLGASAIFDKPVDLDDLAASICALLVDRETSAPRTRPRADHSE